MFINEYVHVAKFSEKVDAKYFKAYWKSDKAGDVGHVTIGADGDRCRCLCVRFKNYKHNPAMAVGYIPEVKFAMRCRDWQDE